MTNPYRDRPWSISREGLKLRVEGLIFYGQVAVHLDRYPGNLEIAVVKGLPIFLETTVLLCHITQMFYRSGKSPVFKPTIHR
jgi:hypothetical protein